MPLELTYAVGRLGAILFGHFDPEDADCEAAAAQSKVPILFVHGDADGFVPMIWGSATMNLPRERQEIFDCTWRRARRELLPRQRRLHEAGNGVLQDCLARRGFVWPPETDEPEK